MNTRLLIIPALALAACQSTPEANDGPTPVATQRAALCAPPTFAGLTSSVAALGTADCAATLTWSAATATCAGTIAYNVYRFANAPGTPGPLTRLTTVTGTSYTDSEGLVSRSRYFYLVRAVETSIAADGGTDVVEETNVAFKSVVASGPTTTFSNYFDDFDTNRPPNANSYFVTTATTINQTTGCRFQSSNRALRFGAIATTCGGQYPINRTDTLVFGGDGTVAGINGFSVPATSVGSELSFSLWYDLEARFDYALLEYSTTGANGPFATVGEAVSLTAPYFLAGGYDLNSTPAGLRVWSGTVAPVNGSLKQVRVTLDALAGSTVWFRFTFRSDATLVREGLYLDDVRLLTQTGAACATGAMTPRSPARLDVTFPTSVIAGPPVPGTVQVRDSFGNVTTSWPGALEFRSTDSRASLPAIAPVVDGGLSFVVAHRTAGPHVLTAREYVDAGADAGAFTGLSGTANVLVDIGAAARLGFVVAYDGGLAGAPFGVVVALQDSEGNTVLDAGSMTVALSLAGSSIGTPADLDAGFANFPGLVITRAAPAHVLQASGGGFTGNSPAFPIFGLPTQHHLRFSQQPTDALVGAVLTPAPTVSVFDQYDNLCPTPTPVSLSVLLGAGPFDGGVTRTTSAGVAAFPDLSFTQPGGYVLAASATTIAPQVSASFQVRAGALDHLTITTQPTMGIAGQTLAPFAVSGFDSAGNAVPTGALTVTASGVMGAVLSGTAAQVPNGPVTSFFSLSLDLPGTYVLTASTAGGVMVASQNVVISAGALARLVFLDQPRSQIAGTTLGDLRVALVDATGNTLTGSTAQVTLELRSGATLSGTTTVAATAGIATFTGLSIPVPAMGHVLRATSGAASGDSLSFDVLTVPVVTPDAGAVDAGAVDAGSGMDAGMMGGMDAGTTPMNDAGTTPMTDAGTGPGAMSGCSCNSSPVMSVLAFAMVALLRRRRG